MMLNTTTMAMAMAAKTMRTTVMMIMMIIIMIIIEDWPRDRSHFLGGIPSIPDFGQTLMTMFMMTMTMVTMVMVIIPIIVVMVLLVRLCPGGNHHKAERGDQTQRGELGPDHDVATSNKLVSWGLSTAMHSS